MSEKLSLIIFSEALSNLYGLNLASCTLIARRQQKLGLLENNLISYLAETADGEYMKVDIFNGVLFINKSESFYSAHYPCKPTGIINSLTTSIIDLAELLKWKLPNHFVELW